MPSSREHRFNRPHLFSPTAIRQIRQNDSGTGTFRSVDFDSVALSSLDNTGSFKYNTPGDGIKSTQQLNIDWSFFENHTFFNSAHVKTNSAFRKLFDKFPFDGTQAELEIFVDSLSGFEKYVLDSFPKNVGYLFLSGTAVGETGNNGTFVTTYDSAGVSFPGISRNTSGLSILNPGTSSMTVEFQLYLPETANSNCWILQKLYSDITGNYGFAANLESNGSTTQCNANFNIYSGSNVMGARVTVPKGQWNHLAFVWDRTPSVQQITSYLNGIEIATSAQIECGVINMSSANLLIGSGSTVGSFTPATTMSGAIDELRIWQLTRTPQEIQEYIQKQVFAQPGLALYYKFNEPSGSQSPVILDSSGNSLHGTISSWAFNKNIQNIATSSVAGSSPITFELVNLNPVLFPLHPVVESLNTLLLANAVDFDNANPSRIDRLIPQHYFLDGQDADGLTTTEGPITDGLVVTGTTSDTAKLGETQVILMMLYSWASFFDEIKLYIQSFGDLLQLDYDSADTVPDAFISVYAQQFGITLPPLFTGASLKQYINADNLDNQYNVGTYPLQWIQNQIWRRILINIQDVLKSKGTIHSIKSFIRATGIDPDNNFRIREFGGPTTVALSNVRENRSEISTMVNFSGSANVFSPYLSGSRLQTEAGFPLPDSSSTFIGGISSNPSDGLFTSGSWTFEGIYRFPVSSSLSSLTQSLARIHTTGSMAPGNTGVNGFLLANLVATPDGMLQLAVAPNTDSSILTMAISANVYDGALWNVSFGRQRNDEIGSFVSSSYFLRAAKQNYGEIILQQTSSVFYNEATDGVANILWNNVGLKASGYNDSGSYIAIGSESIPTNSNYKLLNSSLVSPTFQATRFDGFAGHFRFWSKGLSAIEWTEHVKNLNSLGVDNPFANFNFVSNQTGSFQRLRMDVTSDQPITTSNASGFIEFIDFSQNNLNWSGSFPASSTVVQPQLFQYSLLSPKFDVGSTTDKVRVRSFQNYSNVLSSPYAQMAPLYSIPPSESPQDSTGFTIDFSVVDALDQDIVNIFSSMTIMDSAMGNPELMFSPDYPSLEVLRTIYFNRLTDCVNLKGFFDFYKWFDTNIGTFIEQLVPRKTRFTGINFVIEQSCLERSKVEYKSSDSYLGDLYRQAQASTHPFALITGTAGR